MKTQNQNRVIAQPVNQSISFAEALRILKERQDKEKEKLIA